LADGSIRGRTQPWQAKRECLLNRLSAGIIARRVARWPLRFNEESVQMAEGKKSKTNVAARQEAKQAAQICKNCGKKIDVVMTLSSNGKKLMVRRCCGVTI